MEMLEHHKNKLLQAGFVFLFVVLLLRAFVWMQYYVPEYPGLSTQEMVKDTAKRPFINRMLVGQTAALLDHAMTDESRVTVAQWARSAAHAYAELTAMEQPAITDKDDSFFYWRFLVGIIMFGFLLAYGLALFKLAECLFPRTAGKYIAPLIGYFIAPSGLWQAAFIYDPATLFFAAWCFYLMLAGRWSAYLIYFALACMNKETALYILLLFALCNHDRLARPRFHKLLFAQAGIYVFLYFAIRGNYAANEGYMYNTHWMDYIKNWTGTVTVDHVTAMLAGVFLLAYRWAEKPLMLKRAAWIGGLATGVWMYFGRMEEVRGLYDAFPIFTMLLTHGFVAGIGNALACDTKI
jgi:hypothetical protein